MPAHSFYGTRWKWNVTAMVLLLLATHEGENTSFCIISMSLSLARKHQYCPHNADEFWDWEKMGFLEPPSKFMTGGRCDPEIWDSLVLRVISCCLFCAASPLPERWCASVRPRKRYVGLLRSPCMSGRHFCWSLPTSSHFSPSISALEGSLTGSGLQWEDWKRKAALFPACEAWGSTPYV